MTTVRVMTQADVRAVSALRVAGWQAAYAGLIPQSYLDGMTVEGDARERHRRFAHAREGAADFVAVDGAGKVVGWACVGPYRGEVAPGELYALYVRPSLIGSGIGRALMDTAHTHARTHGFTSIRLWVLRDNTRARRFYERAGYTPDGTAQTEPYDGVPIPEVRYERAL
jgi:ribosomal protein S18 acetylase RimI-like enzyme